MVVILSEQFLKKDFIIILVYFSSRKNEWNTTGYADGFTLGKTYGKTVCKCG